MALESLGGTCVFASEVDECAIATYARNFGGECPAGDISEIPDQAIPEHDLLCGGFPCQSFSIAGQQQGLAQDQLFFEVLRLASAKRPRAILLENVPNLMAIRGGHDLHLITTALANVGYWVRVGLVNAAAYVPQHRERLFIIGLRDDLPRASAAFSWPLMPSNRPPPLRSVLQSNSEFDPASYALTDTQWAQVQRSHAYRRGGPSWRLARLDGLARTLRSSYRSSCGLYSEFVVPDELTTEQREALSRILAQPLDSSGHTSPQENGAMSGDVDLDVATATDAGHHPKDVSATNVAIREKACEIATTWAGTPQAATHGAIEIQRENETRQHAERALQTSNDEASPSRAQHLKRLTGEGDWGFESKPSKRQIVDQPGGGTSQPTADIARTARALGVWPRLYTERECLRLQGFPEEFQVAGKGKHYVQIGNAVCPLVIQAIARQMLLALLEEDAVAKETLQAGDMTGEMPFAAEAMALRASGAPLPQTSDVGIVPRTCPHNTHKRSSEAMLSEASLDLLNSVVASSCDQEMQTNTNDEDDPAIRRLRLRAPHELFCQRCGVSYLISPPTSRVRT